MAMNKDGNGYVLGFATVMVVVVGAILAFIAVSLKPMQKANIKNEQMQFVLKAINVEVSREEAATEFYKYVKRRVIFSDAGAIISDKTGEIVAGDAEDGFNIDLLKEYKGVDKADRNYPLYVCEKEGKTYYVAPVMGSGLWAAIWGYIGVEADFNTVYGAAFDHKSETPGLGSEIATPMFTDQFPGKTIGNNGTFTGISVVKPGVPLTDHSVDGISGGTFTSVGVDEMIKRTLSVYYNYYQTNKSI